MLQIDIKRYRFILGSSLSSKTYGCQRFPTRRFQSLQTALISAKFAFIRVVLYIRVFLCQMDEGGKVTRDGTLWNPYWPGVAEGIPAVKVQCLQYKKELYCICSSVLFNRMLYSKKRMLNIMRGEWRNQHGECVRKNDHAHIRSATMCPLGDHKPKSSCENIIYCYTAPVRIGGSVYFGRLVYGCLTIRSYILPPLPLRSIYSFIAHLAYCSAP